MAVTEENSILITYCGVNKERQNLFSVLGKIIFVPPADYQLQFDTPNKYDCGSEPSVSLDFSGNIVEIHKSENYSTLYSHVGRLNEKTRVVKWTVSSKVCAGKEAAVSLNFEGDVRKIP